MARIALRQSDSDIGLSIALYEFTIGMTPWTHRNPACLIVEDEGLIGMDLEDMFREAGYEPVWVSSLRDAMQSIRTTSPAFAIVDLKLRDGDGSALVRELGERSIPFVIHSGSQNDGQPDYAGVVWLSKPVEPAVILTAAEDLLAGVWTRRDPPHGS